MKILEEYRKEIIKYLFTIKSFSDAWNGSWKNKIQEILSKEGLNEDNLLKIGQEARNIFLSTSEGRGQGEVSSAGIAWESFLALYLNLGLVGTRTIVIKPKKEFNFKCIQDSITVNYGSFTSSSETDLIAITFPRIEDFAYGYSYLKKYNGQVFDIEKLKNPEGLTLKKMNEFFNDILKDNIFKIEVNVIQCKTNWNDNAQIPMGWDMIYSSTGFQGRNISIGKNRLSIHKLGDFKYSFMTVPTQKELDKFTSKSTAVLRVKNLSGKNFWGAKTKKEVAMNIGEIFRENFIDSFTEKSFNIRILEHDISIFDLL